MACRSNRRRQPWIGDVAKVEVRMAAINGWVLCSEAETNKQIHINLNSVRTMARLNDRVTRLVFVGPPSPETLLARSIMSMSLKRRTYSSRRLLLCKEHTKMAEQRRSLSMATACPPWLYPGRSSFRSKRFFPLLAGFRARVSRAAAPSPRASRTTNTREYPALRTAENVLA